MARLPGDHAEVRGGQATTGANTCENLLIIVLERVFIVLLGSGSEECNPVPGTGTW